MPMIRKLHIQNYKSVAAAVVDMGDFTVMVGPNGAGKSNVLDSLRFISDALNSTLGIAIQTRGGLSAVRRHSRGHPTNFGFRVVLDLSDGMSADYSFQIAARPGGEFVVGREQLRLRGLLQEPTGFLVELGEWRMAPEGVMLRTEPDTLGLSVLSGIPAIRPVYDHLARMRFYSLEPTRIRAIQTADPGVVLQPSGGNAAAVLREIKTRSPRDYERVCHLLSRIVPGTVRAEYKALGARETLQFKQDVGDKGLWTFDSIGMSDGTLRALGILLAVFQVSKPTVIGIEEPESTIHPAALDVVVSALRESVDGIQVILTSHSPELLDSKLMARASLLAVVAERGRTRVGPIDAQSADAMRIRLFTGGDLLRSDELRPDEEKTTHLEEQLSLFGRAEG